MFIISGITNFKYHAVWLEKFPRNVIPETGGKAGPALRNSCMSAGKSAGETIRCPEFWLKKHNLAGIYFQKACLKHTLGICKSKVTFERRNLMKKIRKRKIAAGLAVITVYCTSVKPPANIQTIYAENVQLPAETNTTFSKAREIESGVSVAGTFPESGGIRYYKFSLEEAGKIDLSVDVSASAYVGGMRIKIYDASQTEIYNSYDSESFSMNDIYLTGGNYYLVAEFSRATSFSFVANMDSMGESFTETQDANNDISSDAFDISLKKKYKGILALNDDIDYYRFNIPAAGLITLNLTNSTSSIAKYVVYDQSMNPVYTNTVSDGGKISVPVSVKNGEYYFAVAKENVNRGTGSYSFAIDYTKKNTAPPKIKKVKNIPGGSMTVTWSPVTGAAGYELWYSTGSGFNSNVVKKETDASVTSTECYGLMRKKKYYVRVRAYSEINGIKECGKWSGRKSVVIKK